MNTSQGTRWERIRVMGRRRFIWTLGVLRIGVPTGILTAVVAWVLGVIIPELAVDPISLLGFVVLMPFFVGLLWGGLMWELNERWYIAAQGQHV